MESITNKVYELINKYKTNDPFKIADHLNIQVSFENLGNILGYYNKNFRVKSIHINENACEGQEIFICGHELGHALLHPDSNTSFLKRHTLFSTEKIELEANYFAVQLLFSNQHFEGQLSVHEAVEQYSIPKRLIEINL